MIDSFLWFLYHLYIHKIFLKSHPHQKDLYRERRRQKKTSYRYAGCESNRFEFIGGKEEIKKEKKIGNRLTLDKIGREEIFKNYLIQQHIMSSITC